MDEARGLPSNVWAGFALAASLVPTRNGSRRAFREIAGIQRYYGQFRADAGSYMPSQEAIEFLPAESKDVTPRCQGLPGFESAPNFK